MEPIHDIYVASHNFSWNGRKHNKLNKSQNRYKTVCHSNEFKRETEREESRSMTLPSLHCEPLIIIKWLALSKPNAFGACQFHINEAL